MDNPQNNIKRFVYFYFNQEEPEKIRQVVPAHVEYWKAANLQGYMGGPFADRTGGLISFLANSISEATEIVEQDPFIMQDLIADKWIKEWIVE
ncbi:MAG TPA: YciI family protein [Anaerolineales bacterium]|nr:YciI family protein [Anaerolineales bacterium]